MYNFPKRIVVAILTAVFLLSIPGTSLKTYASETSGFLDESELGNGILTVNFSADKTDSYLVRAIKGDSMYTYAYTNGIRIPLQEGNGTYRIQILAPAGGNNYTLKAEQSVGYKNEDAKAVYLQSNVIVNWSSATKVIKKAEELTEDSTTDSEKVFAIYKYIVENIKYDYKKAATVKSYYIPDVEDVFKTKTGICYDYAVLFASMLRSVGIPAKVVKGTSTDIEGYHAWNQVYIKETKKWITVDTTADAGLGKSTADTMAKKASHYSFEKQY